MRQAIVTRFMGPTNYNGSRVLARCDAKRVVVPWSYELDTEANHLVAARTLALQLGWLEGDPPWYLDGGSLPIPGWDYAFILLPPRYRGLPL